MPPVGFEPTISAGERPQTYALDRAATGTGFHTVALVYFKPILVLPFLQQLNLQSGIFSLGFLTKTLRTFIFSSTCYMLRRSSCAISGYRRSVHEIFDLLGCYAA